MLLLAYRHSSLLSSKHMKRSLQTNDLCLYYPLTIPSLRHSPLHNIRYGIPDDTWEEPEWEGLLINLFAHPELRETIIETYALNITIEHLKEKHEYEQYKEILETCGERFNVNSSMKNYIILIEAVRDLCVELEKSPITTSTGERKMVKRIQPHITYLTHESEKIT